VVSRRKVLQGLLGITLAGLFAGLYSFFVEAGWWLRVQRWRLALPDWPADWPTDRPLRVAMLADLHAGIPTMGPDRIARIVDKTNGLSPDLILLMGDYRATHPYQTRKVPIDECAPLLARLSAPLGVFAIMGNHDWRDDKAAQAAGHGPPHSEVVLQSHGITVLSNRAIRMETDRGAFWLAGLDSQAAFSFTMVPDRPGADDLDGTLAQITDDAPILLAAHEPDIFTQVPQRVALTMAGHTHGGQIRLLGWAPVVPSRYGSRYAYGHIREQGRQMVVSGGLGCSGFPLRFGMPPEITLLDITRA
jgi:uncharacterized protein